MPTPPKPPHLKLICGTNRKDRDSPPVVVIPALDVIPEPLEWLPNVHAVKEWRRLAPVLVANKLLAEADLSSFGHMCSLHGKIVQLWSAGSPAPGSLLRQYNALASAFGLSPEWRGKVKAAGGKTASRNKFEDLKPE